MKHIIKILTILFAAAMMFTSVLGCAKAPAQPLTAAELLDLGEKYLRELDYEQAIVQFTKLIEIEPKNARAYTGLADAYTALGRTDEAIAILERGLAELPDNAEILAMLESLRPPESTPEPTPIQRTLTEEQYQYLTQLQQAAEALDYKRVYEIYASPEFWKLCDSLPDSHECYIYDGGDGILGLDNNSWFNEDQTDAHSARFFLWRESGMSYEIHNWVHGDSGEVSAVNIYSAEYKDGMPNGEYKEMIRYAPDNSFGVPYSEEFGMAVNGKKHGISICRYWYGDTDSIEFDNGKNLTDPDAGPGNVYPQPLNGYT
jgi:tetratricopeptide (TPR) repeat protein